MSHSDEILDLIVVGAGPGGSAAASEALRSGLSVAQIEKFKFPRVKPCAGGLTPKGAALLPAGFDRLLRGDSSRFEFNRWQRRRNRFGACGPILSFVHRPEFDSAFVKMNSASKNFQFFDHEAVVDVSYDRYFQVKTSNRTFRGRQLVGADGSQGVVNRIFKISRPKAMATALEVVLPREKTCFKGPEVPSFDFGAVSQGYGWVFPKDNHWSAGLYTLKSSVKSVKKKLNDYLLGKGFVDSGSELLASMRAHRYPVGGYRLQVPDIPLYLVGDAAGFAEAITGEGIYYALESGRLAGATAASVQAGRASHRKYYRRLWSSVLIDTMISFRVAGIFYRDPEKWLQRLRLPWMWRPLVQGYSEGRTLSNCALSAIPCLVRSLGKVTLD